MRQVLDMERETRLELATPTLARLCSTTELFPRIQHTYQQNFRGVDSIEARGSVKLYHQFISEYYSGGFSVR